ncbi:unnamed protein product, partial [Timema podura]|nr:unnamed protein product [Timema podura]
EVALCVSHSLLMSSDSMKPKSGDWAIIIFFLQEAAITSLSIGSSVNYEALHTFELLSKPNVLKFHDDKALQHFTATLTVCQAMASQGDSLSVTSVCDQRRGVVSRRQRIQVFP